MLVGERGTDNDGSDDEVCGEVDDVCFTVGSDAAAADDVWLGTLR